MSLPRTLALSSVRSVRVPREDLALAIATAVAFALLFWRPLGTLAANLEFEMIGLPDPKHPKTVMLTGWERSNLGPTLKAQGADIGPDPYPEQNFFQRSDNYQLALKGVVAQTISAWPLAPTYHKPTDDLAHLDLPFMLEVIQSLVEPIRWLVNSDFRPEWNPGMKP